MEPQTETLTTERLLLKEVTPELYNYLFDHLSDDEIKAYFDYDEAGLKQAKGRQEKGMTNYHMTFKYFLLRDKKTNKTIGTCGYYRWYQEHNRAEIGYVMSDTDYREKGLMVEAAKRILQYGFEKMGAHRIEAFASPENKPSIRILEQLGMQQEGLMREHFLRGDVYEPSACFSILKHEYDKSQIS